MLIASTSRHDTNVELRREESAKGSGGVGGREEGPLTQKGPAWARGRPASYVLLGPIGAEFLLATGHAVVNGLV